MTLGMTLLVGLVLFVVIAAFLLVLCASIGLEVYGDQWGRK